MAKEKMKPKIDGALCYGCSLCIVACPLNLLSLTRPCFRGDIHTSAQLTLPEKCSGCGLCAKECPVDAIEME